VKCGGLLDFAVRHDGELGGAATDVDIQDVRVLVVRALRRTRTVGGKHRFHVVAGRGADELAADFREELADRLRVLAPQRLAGEDHRAGVDRIGMQPGGCVRVLDDLADGGLVDAHLARVRRERDRRFIERVAADDEVAAGKVLAHPSHAHAREDHLCAGRADIDADARQRNVVRLPERVFLDRTRLAYVMVVIVVVVRVVVVAVLELGSVGMVGERMRTLRGAAAHSVNAAFRDGI